MKANTLLLGSLQLGKIGIVLSAGAFFKLLLVDVPNAGPWNCVFLENVCVIGPYSPQWYSFYHFFAQIGYTPEIAVFCLIDSLIILTIARVEPFPYSFLASNASFFFLFYDPGDLLIYWLALLSRGHWFMSIVAILTKLPTGASRIIWQYIWTVSLPGIGHSTLINPARWIILGAFVLQPIWGRIWGLTLADRLRRKTTSNISNFSTRN